MNNIPEDCGSYPYYRNTLSFVYSPPDDGHIDYGETEENIPFCVGNSYNVEKLEIKSCVTMIEFYDIPGKWNSINFK